MCTEIGRGRGGPLNAIGGKGTRAAALAQSTHTEGPPLPDRKSRGKYRVARNSYGTRPSVTHLVFN